jgi:hypothetical protein
MKFELNVWNLDEMAWNQCQMFKLLQARCVSKKFCIAEEITTIVRMEAHVWTWTQITGKPDWNIQEIYDKQGENMYCRSSGWKEISRGQMELANVSGIFIFVMQFGFNRHLFFNEFIFFHYLKLIHPSTAQYRK